MNRIVFLVCILVVALLLLLCSCSNRSSDKLPESHTIPYDAELETVGDGKGADSFEHHLDHEDSKYYVFNDFYNMKSGGSLHILTGFETYQQTTEYSCGPASALMVLNHYDQMLYNELEICDLAETDPVMGTKVEGLVKFFDSIGWTTEYHAGTDLYFGSISDAESYIVGKIDEGKPVLVDWADWRGHWQVIIGIDTCHNNNPYDDVLIMADPYDVTDHYQDGYYTVPFGRFFDMWREGPCAQKTKPYEQPFVVAFPAE